VLVLALLLFANAFQMLLLRHNFTSMIAVGFAYTIPSGNVRFRLN